MNVRLLLLGIATAMIAAANSLHEFVKGLPEDENDGDLLGKMNNTLAAVNTGIAPTAIATTALDADGLPWDERIHSGSKETNKDGTWRKRKGVDANVVTAVTAELRQHYPAPTAPVVTPTAPTAPTAPVVPTAPAAAAPTVPTFAAPAAMTPYQKLTDWLAKNTGPGKVLTAEWVTEVLAGNNTSLAALASAPAETINLYLDGFRQALAGTGTAEVQ